MLKIAERWDMRIFVERVTVDLFKHFATSDRLPIYTYLRLLAPGILHEVNRFLYLDADLLVRSSVYPLYEMLTEDTAAAAVRDYYHARKRVAPDILRIARRGERTVFQCGVMLVNAEAWRNRKVPEQALAYLDLHASTVLHGDQDGGRSERVGSIVECATRRF